MPASSKRYATDLTDEQWERVRPFVDRRMGRPPSVDRREIVNAVLYLVRTGCQWRMLPDSFPHWATVHSCYRRWRLDGTDGEPSTLDRLHDALRRDVRRHAERDPEPSVLVVDSQSVKTTEKGGRGATTPASTSTAASATSS